MTQLRLIITTQAQQQNQSILEIKQLQGELALVQSQQAVSRSVVNTPSFAVSKIKLELPPKFAGKPSKLNGWIFQVEQHCGMVGINNPTDMVKLAVSRLEGDAFIWWWQLVHRGQDFELGMLMWSDFPSELVNAFIDVDHEIRFCGKLAPLKQQTSVTSYTKQFQKIVLQLGSQAPDESALLFMFIKGLKADVQIYGLLEQSQFLSKSEWVAERSAMALFLSGKYQSQGQPQCPRQQPWQYNQYGYQKSPPLPPRQGPVPMDLGAIQGQQQFQLPQPQLTPDRQIICYCCGKQGHMAKDCWVRIRGLPTQTQPNLT